MDRSGGNPSKSTIKGLNTWTRLLEFGQWFSPINFKLFEDNVKALKLDHYTKKLKAATFMKLFFFTQYRKGTQCTYHKGI